MAIRGYSEGTVDAIVVAGGDRAIGERLVKISSKYRVICGMMSDLEDFDRRCASQLQKRSQDGERCRSGSRGEDEGQRIELKQLIVRTDRMLRRVYDALPENALFIVSAQGGVHTSGVDQGGDICPADNAVAILGIKC